MKTVFEFGGRNPFKATTTKTLITLEQAEDKAARFRCTYGLQVDSGLIYSTACSKLGEAILHHLACNGEVNNEGE